MHRTERYVTRKTKDITTGQKQRSCPRAKNLLNEDRRTASKDLNLWRQIMTYAVSLPVSEELIEFRKSHCEKGPQLMA